MPRPSKSRKKLIAGVDYPSLLMRDVCRYIRAVRCIPALTDDDFNQLNNEYYKLTHINQHFNSCPKCWNDAITLLTSKFGENWYRQSDDDYFITLLNGVKAKPKKVQDAPQVIDDLDEIYPDFDADFTPISSSYEVDDNDNDI